MVGGTKVVRAVAAVAAVVLLGSCASKPGDAGAREDGPLTIGGVFCLCHTGVYIAWQKGFFEDHGIEVEEFTFTTGGSETFQAVASGHLDFGVLSHEAVVRGVGEGLDVRSVAGVYPEFWALQVGKDLAGEVKGIEDLKGKKIGVSKVGSGSWAFLVAYAQQQGLNPDSDIEILQLGDINSIVTAVRSGSVDAAVTWEPGTSQLESSGAAATLVDLHQASDQQEVFGTPTSLSQTIATTVSFIENNPDTVEGLVAALNDAYRWMHEHTPEEVAEAVAPMAEGVDLDILLQAIKREMPLQPESAEISDEAYRASMDLLQEAGALDDVPVIEDVFDCNFAGCGP